PIHATHTTNAGTGRQGALRGQSSRPQPRRGCGGSKAVSSAMPMTAMSQAAVEPAWKRILLGPDKKMHLGTIMCLLVCTQYLLWFLIIGLVLLPHGLASP